MAVQTLGSWMREPSRLRNHSHTRRKDGWILCPWFKQETGEDVSKDQVRAAVIRANETEEEVDFVTKLWQQVNWDNWVYWKEKGGLWQYTNDTAAVGKHVLCAHPASTS